MDGASIEDIADNVKASPEQVSDILKEYKNSQKVKGVYTEEFMKLIANRDRMNIQRNTIMKELNVSRTILIKSIKKYGFIKKIDNDASEEIIGKIDTANFEFKECPECSSKKINTIETLHNDATINGIYCIKCGNEFFSNRGYIYKVKWENVD